MTHLNHDHCEREHVHFFAMFPTLQDLWSRQVLDSDRPVGGCLSGIHIRSDRSDRETHNSRATIRIHEHVRLAEYQHGDEANVRIITYPLEITMNYIMRMEVIEAIGDFG